MTLKRERAQMISSDSTISESRRFLVLLLVLTAFSNYFVSFAGQLPPLNLPRQKAVQEEAPAPGKGNFEQYEWDMLEKGLFARYDTSVQAQVMNWAADFREQYGEQAFDTLLTRFMRSRRYRELKVKAGALRSQPEAQKMFREIEKLSNLIPERHREWMDAAREARADLHFQAREFSEYLRRSRTDAERLWRDLSDLVKRHNSLVMEYNRNFMGGIEFYSLTR